MAGKAKINVGVIGLGWAGREHCKGYLECPQCELVALCDANPELLGKVAEDFGTDVFTDVDEFLKNAGVDAVSVCLPNYLHFPISKKALLAGKHVLCEKPPALNALEARKLRDIADRKKLKMMYAFVQRFTSESVYVKNMIEDGEFGNVYYGKATYVRQRGIPIGASGWFVDKKRSGGGALIDIGVHPLDRVWWLMGTPKPVSVMAGSFSLFGHTVPKGVKYNVDDNTFALFRMENGAVLILEATWAWNLPGQVQAKISGTKAGADLNPLAIYSEKNGSIVTITPSVKQNKPFAAETAHFVECIISDKTPVSSADQGYRLMAMIDAAYRSAATGREVKIRLQ